jgi:hypothetical protein
VSVAGACGVALDPDRAGWYARGMWWLLHGGEKTRVVPGGERFVARCPSCQAEAQMVEVEVTTSAGAFFVDVVKAKDRGYRCQRCGEVAIEADAAPASRPGARPAPAPARDYVAEAAAARAEAQARRAELDTRLDDELAELKRKMGR